jgi:hypothetical protein
MPARISLRRFFSSAAATAVLFAALTGCGGTPKGGSPATPGPAESAPQPSARQAAASPAFEPFANEASAVMGPARAGQGKPGEPAGTWSIVIAGAAGENADATARDMLHKVQTVGGLPEAYTERRGGSVVVAFGQYSGPEDRAAQRDLARLRDMELEGGKPFAGAVLVPPPFESLPGSIPEFDLNGVKRARGKDALYTLQVAIYTRLNTNAPKPEELAEFRKAAERAVVELRRGGDEAYYYHGPRGSTVTVGVFGPRDHDPLKPGSDSFALLETRRKHPLNLVNGAQFLTRSRGQEKARPQPSFLVPIP